RGGRGRKTCVVCCCLSAAYVDRVLTLGGVFHVVAHLVTFTDRLLQAGLVRENVLATLVRGDESETLGFIEKLDCACGHCTVDWRTKLRHRTVCADFFSCGRSGPARGWWPQRSRAAVESLAS